MKTYYLYRHLDLPNNRPFYIGIGTNDKYLYYYRAKNRNKRSREWLDYIISISNKYEIEILFETANKKLIVEKEIEFIKLYGRIDMKTGTLVNKNGGNGIGELSEKTINSMIKKQKCKEVVVYNSNGDKVGVFDRAASAAEYTNVPYLSIKQCLMKKNKQSKGFRFLKKEEEVDKLLPLAYKPFNRDVPIRCENLKTGNIITYNNMSEAHKKLGIPLGSIGNNLNGTTKTVHKKTYKFNYL